VFPQHLDVFNHLRQRHVAQVGIGLCCQWSAAAGGALVEKKDAEYRRVEESTRICRRAGTRATG
jgi:hypothetical protein